MAEWESSGGVSFILYFFSRLWVLFSPFVGHWMYIHTRIQPDWKFAYRIGIIIYYFLKGGSSFWRVLVVAPMLWIPKSCWKNFFSLSLFFSFPHFNSSFLQWTNGGTTDSRWTVEMARKWLWHTLITAADSTLRRRTDTTLTPPYGNMSP